MFIKLTPLKDQLAQGVYSYSINPDNIVVISETDYGSCILVNQYSSCTTFYHVRESLNEIIEKINKIDNPIK